MPLNEMQMLTKDSTFLAVSSGAIMAKQAVETIKVNYELLLRDRTKPSIYEYTTYYVMYN